MQAFIFFLKSMGWMTLSRKNKQHVIYNCPKFGTMVARKTRLLFFNRKTYFNPFFYYKHLENTSETLFPQKTQKKDLKNQHENKKFPNLVSFLGVFKVRKHLILTLLVI